MEAGRERPGSQWAYHWSVVVGRLWLSWAATYVMGAPWAKSKLAKV
jgi:hypothetical protein